MGGCCYTFYRDLFVSKNTCTCLFSQCDTWCQGLESAIKPFQSFDLGDFPSAECQLVTASNESAPPPPVYRCLYEIKAVYDWQCIFFRSWIGLCCIPWRNRPDADLAIVGHLVLSHVAHPWFRQRGKVLFVDLKVSNEHSPLQLSPDMVIPFRYSHASLHYRPSITTSTPRVPRC